jgi:hypothetical protein
MIAISCILIFISSIARAISNKIQFHYDKSVFRNKKWFNPLTSWKNKWKLNSAGNPIMNNKGNYKERFFGSSTIFVLFTDAWHLFESVSKYTLIGAVVTWAYFSLIWWWLLILIAIMIITFHIFFTWIFSKK